MKKILLYVMVLLAALSCAKKAEYDQTLGLLSKYNVLSKDGGSTQVAVFSNTSWTVEMDRQVDWASIDRFNGKLLNAETTAQPSCRITVFTITVELALYINPNAPEQYQHEGFMTYRVTSPDGRLLDQTDDVPDGSVISVMYNDTVLDSLIISID